MKTIINRALIFRPIYDIIYSNELNSNKSKIIIGSLSYYYNDLLSIRLLIKEQLIDEKNAWKIIYEQY
jgi:hypothetical protein